MDNDVWKNIETSYDVIIKDLNLSLMSLRESQEAVFHAVGREALCRAYHVKHGNVTGQPDALTVIALAGLVKDIQRAADYSELITTTLNDLANLLQGLCKIAALKNLANGMQDLRKIADGPTLTDEVAS